MSVILAIKTSFNPKFRYLYGISLYFPNFLYISTAILGKERVQSASFDSAFHWQIALIATLSG